MKIKMPLKNLLKRASVLIIIIAVCAAAIYFSLKSLNHSISVLSRNKIKGGSKTIILDAGHGGMDGGCSSVNDIPEKGINLNIVLYLRDMLELSGYPVVLTRETDCSIYDSGTEGIANQKLSDMENRLDIFNSVDNAVCISVHQNQFTDPQYSGAQIFYSSHIKENAELAQTMQNSFVEMIQPDNTREIKECGDSLYLCCNSKNPTVMVECGFLSNPDEAVLLESEDYQKKIAFTIFYAIQSYLS